METFISPEFVKSQNKQRECLNRDRLDPAFYSHFDILGSIGKNISPHPDSYLNRDDLAVGAACPNTDYLNPPGYCSCEGYVSADCPFHGDA